MARPADLIVDETPLDGARINVRARIGWLLRIHRQVAGVPLGDVAAQFGEAAGRSTSVAALSRLERAGTRSGHVIDAYETVLGLRPGRLRAPIDLLCRAYDDAPDDEAARLPEPPSLTCFDTVVAAVEGTPTGADWLAFARLHADDAPFGLRSQDMAPLVEKLARELGRSVGEGYVSRMEALKRLRCSPYEDILEDLSRTSSADPERQVHTDLLSIVAERPTRSVLQWSAQQLSSSSFLAARGAALAIERMSLVGGLDADDWLSITDPVVEAIHASKGDPLRPPVLASALWAIPAAQRCDILKRLGGPPPRPRVPAAWTPSRRNAHYRYAERLAGAICQRHDVPEQPMLTRLLFEVLYDFRATRQVTAGFVLLASPFIDGFPEAMEEAVLRAPDATTRTGALSLGGTVPMAWEGLDLDAWLGAEDPAVLAGTLVVAGQGGVQLPADVLEQALTSKALRDRATYSAGMAQHPVLEEWARDDGRPERLRRAAAWWRREGGRVVL